MMPIPDTIIQNDFLDNLGDDLVAVDPTGHIVGRAQTREALEHAHAGETITIYGAADFADPAPETADEEPPAIATSDDVVTDDATVDEPPTDALPKKSRKKTS